MAKKKTCKSVFGTFFFQENITQFGPNQKSLKLQVLSKYIYIDIYKPYNHLSNKSRFSYNFSFA